MMSTVITVDQMADFSALTLSSNSVDSWTLVQLCAGCDDHRRIFPSGRLVLRDVVLFFEDLRVRSPVYIRVQSFIRETIP